MRWPFGIIAMTNRIQINIANNILFIMHFFGGRWSFFLVAVVFVSDYYQRLRLIRASKCVSLFAFRRYNHRATEVSSWKLFFEAMNTNATVESQPREYRLKRAITRQQRYFSVSQTILGITYCFNGFESNRSVRCALSSRLLVLFLSIKRESLIWLLKQINLDTQNLTRQSSIPFFYFLNNVFELLLSMRLLFSFVWTYRKVLCVNMLWFIHFTLFYFISFHFDPHSIILFFSNVFVPFYQ